MECAGHERASIHGRARLHVCEGGTARQADRSDWDLGWGVWVCVYKMLLCWFKLSFPTLKRRTKVHTRVRPSPVADASSSTGDASTGSTASSSRMTSNCRSTQRHNSGRTAGWKARALELWNTVCSRSESLLIELYVRYPEIACKFTAGALAGLADRLSFHSQPVLGVRWMARVASRRRHRPSRRATRCPMPRTTSDSPTRRVLPARSRAKRILILRR